MKQAVFGQTVTAVDVERIPADTGPTHFVRLCGALIGRALADRVGSFTLPVISERITVPDGGVDAEYTTPERLSLSETGGLIGPGTTVFQFKYRDASARGRSAIVQKIVGQLRKESPLVAPRCDRYVLLTNVHLSGTQPRRLREALAEGLPAFSGKQIVIWGAAEIALALNLTPHLRHLFLSEGRLATPDLSESELKAAYSRVPWPPFVNREDEAAAIGRFVQDPTARILQVQGPRYVGKTRLVLEALKPFGASILWVASPEDATLDLFRDLDSPDTNAVLVIDRCDETSSQKLEEWARERQRLKTIVIHTDSESRPVPGEKHRLLIEPLGDEQARQLLASVVPGIPFGQQSWITQATGGLPGLLLHVGELVRDRRTSLPLNADELQDQLGSLLERRYLATLASEARYVLEVASLLPVLGVVGAVGNEVEAVCRALNLAPGALKTHLPTLERRGLICRRGRFIEVVPPRLAEHLASRTLTHPERILVELQIALDPAAFLRFLEHFRNLRNEQVQTTIAKLFAVGGWFDALDTLDVRKLHLLAPATPFAALSCLERILGPLSAEELERRVDKDVRPELVWTLDDLALRSETFEGAASLLLALAAAETEKSANNATGVFVSLFHWQHPEITVSLSRRLGVLQEGTQLESATSRRIVAAACGEAFREDVVVSLHHPKGAAFPADRYRPATWDEVGNYAGGVLDLLAKLHQDDDSKVSQAAISSLFTSSRPFLQVSLRLATARNGLPQLGKATLQFLGEVGRATQSARVRADVLNQLQLIIETFSKAKDLLAAEQAVQLAKKLSKELTESTFRDRLWRWIGPDSWELRRQKVDEATRLQAVESLASQFLRSLQVFAEHLAWLTSKEARQGPALFQLIGKQDRGGELFTLLLSRAGEPLWSQAFSAYVIGWFSSDPASAESTLDQLTDTRPDLLEGVLKATCSVPPSDRTIERVLRLVAKSSTPKPDLVGQIAMFMPWGRLSAKDAEKLITTLDDGTSEVRSALLPAFEARLFRGAEISASLQDLAWSFLESAFPIEVHARGHDWDILAATLGEEEPERLLQLIERLAITHLTGPRKGFNWTHELPLVWGTLDQSNRQGLLQMLLRLVAKAEVPYWIDWTLSQMIDPSRDRETLLQFTNEAGVESARAVALNLEADKPGFWDLARDLISRWGDDDRLKDRLHSSVMSGGWQGSAVPMIAARTTKAKELLRDPDPRVAKWAQEVVDSLESRRRHEERQDREEWIWDYRIRRSELEEIVRGKDSPERLWAIGRLLEDAPEERVRELLTPEAILEALPKLDQLDERTRQKWEGWARHWSQVH